MKLIATFRLGLGLLSGLALLIANPLRAQEAPLTPAQVDQLLGPIALYPDALVALILPASSMPGDVVLAARFLDSGGNPDQIEYQPWNDSLKSLARYPVLVKWMDENLAWTQQLGQAFLTQPDEVMDAVQRLRVRARANGTLVSNSQQKVVLDGDIIRIVPAEPEVIYVPYYDPDVVYAPQPIYYGYPYVTYGAAFPIGIWLTYDVDWHHHHVWVGDKHHNWQNHGDWNNRYGPGGPSGWRQWNAPANRPPYAKSDYRRPKGDMPRPGYVPGAPPQLRHDNPGREGDRPNNHREAGPAPPAGPTPNSAPQPNSSDQRNRHDRPPTPPTSSPGPNVVPSPGPAATGPSPVPNTNRGRPPMPSPPPQNPAGPMPVPPSPGGSSPAPMPRPNVNPSPNQVIPAPPPIQNPKDSNGLKGPPNKDTEAAH